MKKVLIATGGSGGHIIPGLAIAQKLKAKGLQVEFIGSGEIFSHLVEEQGFIFNEIKATKFSNRGIIGKISALLHTCIGIIKILFKMRKIKPSYILGMGSYASIATVIAGKLIGIPTAIHEQNVKPGKTNRYLMHFADKIFLSFEKTKQFLPKKINSKNDIVVTGCPVEEKVLNAIKVKRPTDGKFRILVLGGSQGARILSDVVPHALISLPPEVRDNVIITQQTRPEDLKRVEKIYKDSKVDHTLNSYFDDLPEKIRHANLIIARSGAGTVCEISVLGRTAIFVPLLLADGHQLENARELADKNAAIILETSQFTPSNVANEILRFIEQPEILKDMEKNSLSAVKLSKTAAESIANEIATSINKD